ncbi:MAG: TerD family protein [Bacilli bacterium]
MLNFFNKKSRIHVAPIEPISTEPIDTGSICAAPLNLTKGAVLNLNKSTYDALTLAAGWDTGYDLDLFAVITSKSNDHEIVYFGRREKFGVKLHGDNLTGDGDGDDEIITLSLNDLPANITKVTFGVAIYRDGVFKNVKNAYMRLLSNGTHEICRYDLSESGGDNDAVIACHMLRTGDTWVFQAEERYVKSSVQGIVRYL